MLLQRRAVHDYEDANVNLAATPKDFGIMASGWTKEYRAYRRPSWSDIMESYSRLEFTNISDKLPALAKITDFFADGALGVPLLGHWSRGIATTLAWRNRTRDSRHSVQGLPT